MKKINTAIIGCGVISEVYIQSIKEKFSVLQLCACSDLDLDRMNATANYYLTAACSILGSAEQVFAFGILWRQGYPAAG